MITFERNNLIDHIFFNEDFKSVLLNNKLCRITKGFWICLYIRGFHLVGPTLGVTSERA